MLQKVNEVCSFIRSFHTLHQSSEAETQMTKTRWVREGINRFLFVSVWCSKPTRHLSTAATINMTTANIEARIREEINKSKHQVLTAEYTAGHRVFVIGDIHGCLEELQDLLKTAGVDTQNDVIISVGDVLNKVCWLLFGRTLPSADVDQQGRKLFYWE